MTPDGPLRELDRRRRAPSSPSADRRVPSPRRSRSCCCTPTVTRSTSARSATALAPSAARRARVALARGRRHVPRVRARGDDRDRRGAVAAAGRLSAPARRARARGGPARARDHAVERRPDRPRRGRRPRRLDRAVRPRRRRGGRGVRGPGGGRRDALCFDMGGTSCDVCVVDGGSVQERSAARSRAGRWRCRCSRSTRWARAAARSPGAIAGGALRVGPRSAGADPGPACYGRGGTEPTVTDANLVLGFLAADAPLAGGVELDLDAAERAVGALADELGLEPLDVRRGDRRVANAEMVRALRVVTVRARDRPAPATRCWRSAAPARCTPPQIADELGIDDDRLSARVGGARGARAGRLAAAARRPAERAAGRRRADCRGGRTSDVARARRARPRARCASADAELRATYELRYRGQAFELADRRRRRARARRAARGVRGRSTRSATATATPSRSSSWSRSA